MAINLVKGQRVEIGLSKLVVEMGWKVNPNAKPPYDLDASTFLLRANGEIGVEEDFVFYGSCKTIETPDGKRPVSNDGSVLGSVDDLGDDEDNTGEGNEEICRYDLDEDFSTEKGVEFGRLYRRNGAWKFEAVGTPYADGLEPICRKYASKFM